MCSQLSLKSPLKLPIDFEGDLQSKTYTEQFWDDGPNDANMDEEIRHIEETKPQFLLIHMYTKNGTLNDKNYQEIYARKIKTICN